MIVRIHGRQEDGKRGYVEFQCAVDGCGEQPTYCCRVTDTGKDLPYANELYVLCSKHTDLTFFYPPKVEP